MDTTPQVGIIGLGQFGRFAAAHLAPHFDVAAYDPEPPAATIPRVELMGLAEVAAAQFVLLCVPVQQLRDVLTEIGPFLQADACVIDACSVKMVPMQWLEEVLPPNADYLGAHPLFGPNSATEGFEGHTVVLCPGRGEQLECVAEFLRSLGLFVIITDAETHDRDSARAQALAQYVGRGLRSVARADSDITTYAADLLNEVAIVVGDDSWELFEAIQKLNPFAAEARRELRASLDDLDRRLDES
jgi:prephenate dehydrogenase